MDKRRNLFLVGPMGAGKTTIGRHLARTLKLEFVDSDQEIERRTGADIPWIFDIEGEDGFRKRERAVIQELTRRDGVVLATGGGAVLDPKNRADLAAHGTVIYLHASPAHIVKRTAKSHNRPLLKTDDRRGRVMEILAVRDPLYREIADIIVETDTLGVRGTVSSILASCRLKPRRRAPSKRGGARSARGSTQSS